MSFILAIIAIIFIGVVAVIILALALLGIYHKEDDLKKIRDKLKQKN